jgi:peptide-methionine (R)-S-oxide reductase
MSNDYRRDLEAIAKIDDHQFAATQLGVTEPPFENEFWDKHDPGIYVDIVSGGATV